MKRLFAVFIVLVALAACGEKSVAKLPELGLAALRVTPMARGTDKADKVVELKEDGTILVDGVMAAKIKGDHVESADGTSMLTVGANGRLVGRRVGPGFKFEGDELVTDAGAKVSVGDDGAIVVTKDRGTETIAKVEGGRSAKRAALVVTVLWLTLPMYVTTDTSKTDTAPPASNAP